MEWQVGKREYGGGIHNKKESTVGLYLMQLIQSPCPTSGFPTSPAPAPPTSPAPALTDHTISLERTENRHKMAKSARK